MYQMHFLIKTWKREVYPAGHDWMYSEMLAQQGIKRDSLYIDALIMSEHDAWLRGKLKGGDRR